MANNNRAELSTLIRGLAAEMTVVNRKPKRASLPAKIMSADEMLAALAAQYRDKPMPLLSAKARKRPTEMLRPLRAGSKWGLPG